MELNKMADILTTLKMALPESSPREVTKPLVALWCNALKDFDNEQIMKAFRQAYQNLSKFPPPVTIKRYCEGQTKNPEEYGQDAAGRIESAIRKWGYSSPKHAEKDIGTLGWEVVLRCGGWSSICEVTYDGLPSARKAWRETAASILTNHSTHGYDKAPELPHASGLNISETEFLP